MRAAGSIRYMLVTRIEQFGLEQVRKRGLPQLFGKRGQAPLPDVFKLRAVFLCVLFLCVTASYQKLNAQAPQQAERHSYQIDLKIDFENLTYTGTERVRWINRGEKSTSVIYFHLYPNLRTGDQSFVDSDEPRID